MIALLGLGANLKQRDKVARLKSKEDIPWKEAGLHGQKTGRKNIAAGVINSMTGLLGHFNPPSKSSVCQLDVELLTRPGDDNENLLRIFF